MAVCSASQYLSINLLLLYYLILIQISNKSSYTSPIQTNDNWSNSDAWLDNVESYQEDDDPTEEQLEARIRMFSDQQIDLEDYSILGDIAYSTGLDGRKAIADQNYLWPGGEIPYKYHEKLSNDSIPKIEAAINDWNNLTCINLRPVTEADSNYVVFHSDNKGCWSFVGDRRAILRGQPINIGTGCEFKHTILHEIGHSLGLYHEQSRSDRDSILKVLWNNISPGLQTQFLMANDQNFSIGYDVMSVMQYADWAFSRRMFELNSVATNDPKLQNLLGKGRELSFRDIKVISILYNCSDTCTNKNELNCLNEGFISAGKRENNFRCTCVCPPTHQGESCEKRVPEVSSYYEGMNVTYCGGQINETDQIIEQPVNSTACTWSINAPENQFIQIEFEHFFMRDRFQSKLGNKSEVNDRCVYESLELRTENHYDGLHYCGNDIKSGDKFESKKNIMILIVHTYVGLETKSKGFRAKIKFLDQPVTENSITTYDISTPVSSSLIDSSTTSPSTVSSTSPSIRSTNSTDNELISSTNSPDSTTRTTKLNT